MPGPPLSAPRTASSPARSWGWGPPAGCRARAHAGLVRAVYAPVRAPRLEPSARSRLRCHSQLPGAAAAASPRPGALSAGPAPLAPSQEDELEEDAWAREYRGGGGAAGRARRAGRRWSRAEPLPAGSSVLWPRVAAPDPRPGQPLPQPTSEGGREGEGGRQ